MPQVGSLLLLSMYVSHWHSFRLMKYKHFGKLCLCLFDIRNRTHLFSTVNVNILQACQFNAILFLYCFYTSQFLFQSIFWKIPLTIILHRNKSQQQELSLNKLSLKLWKIIIETFSNLTTNIVWKCVFYCTNTLM